MAVLWPTRAGGVALLSGCWAWVLPSRRPDAAPEGRLLERAEAEGLRIVAFEPSRRFAFTWSAPPSLPQVPAQRTLVVIELEPVGEAATRLRFTHEGWGKGSEWDADLRPIADWIAVDLVRKGSSERFSSVVGSTARCASA